MASANAHVTEMSQDPQDILDELEDDSECVFLPDEPAYLWPAEGNGYVVLTQTSHGTWHATGESVSEESAVAILERQSVDAVDIVPQTTIPTNAHRIDGG